MAIDTLILGPFEFTDFQVPANMPFGGKQQLNIHKLPGGSRVVDAMGPDDNDRKWSGILWGDDAADNMILLDQMRIQGTELSFSWGAESRTCIISEFTAEVERWTVIHYSITIAFTDSSGSSSSPAQSLAFMLVADLSNALGSA